MQREALVALDFGKSSVSSQKREKTEHVSQKPKTPIEFLISNCLLVLSNFVKMKHDVWLMRLRASD